MKVKLKLDSDNSIGYGYLLLCCGIRQQFSIDELEPGDIWNCVSCEKPLVLRWGNEYYEIGKNITI